MDKPFRLCVADVFKGWLDGFYGVFTIIFPIFNPSIKNAVKMRLKVGTPCVVLDQSRTFSSSIPCQILNSTAEGETPWKRN